nr:MULTISPECIES: ABC transporter ATP-binding protein [Butyricimonas]
MNQAMILAENIGMTYRQVLKEIVALKEISIEVKEGEVFGLIGPDGAGKSTLFRILTTLLLPTRGRAFVGGFDVIDQYREVRNIVGYMPGKFSLYQDLSVEENLHFFANVFDTTIQSNYDQIKDIYEQLAPFKNRKAGALSGGMKQKLGLCCALIHKPKVLFLDEPTTGVDPVSRKEFWDVLKRLGKEGMSVLVSTPYMDEARLCDRIGLIFHGKLLAVDTPERLIRKHDKKLVAFRSRDMYRLLRDIREEPGVYSCFTFGDSLHTTFREGDYPVERFAVSLREAGHVGVEWNEIEAGIEDYFMMLTNDISDGTGH